MAAKQGHEHVGKGCKPFVKGQQRWFAGNYIADQHGDKIDEIVVPKAGAGKPHLVLNGVLDPRVREHARKDGHFSQPGRGSRDGCWGDLDRDWSRGGIQNVTSSVRVRSHAASSSVPPLNASSGSHGMPSAPLCCATSAVSERRVVFRRAAVLPVGA